MDNNAAHNTYAFYVAYKDRDQIKYMNMMRIFYLIETSVRLEGYIIALVL